MTEYDYSPDAMERYLAKQQQIGKWVDQTAEQSPCNPFVTLPSEHAAAQTPHPQPQPALYATPQGFISPTYSSSRKHGHGHSQHGPGNTYLTIPQGYTPVAGRSFSNPSTPVRNFYSAPSTPYNPYPTGSPLTPSPQGSPYHSPPISHPSHSQSSFHSNTSHLQPNPVIQQPPGGNPYFQPSHSQSSFHSASSSHIQGNPVMHQQPGSYPYLQPQPMVVVRGDGGCIVVAAPGQQVQIMNPPSVYEAQDGGPHQGQSLFGKLVGLGMKRPKSKKFKRSRKDSF